MRERKERKKERQKERKKEKRKREKEKKNFVYLFTPSRHLKILDIYSYTLAQSEFHL